MDHAQKDEDITWTLDMAEAGTPLDSIMIDCSHSVSSTCFTWKKDRLMDECHRTRSRRTSAKPRVSSLALSSLAWPLKPNWYALYASPFSYTREPAEHRDVSRVAKRASFLPLAAS